MATKFDVQWLTLTEHILPRFGLSAKDVNLALVPIPEVASAIFTGDVAAAFPFEPYGTNALTKGCRDPGRRPRLVVRRAWPDARGRLRP
jgi:hypothetical protein